MTNTTVARLALGVSLAGTAVASAEEQTPALKDRWDLSAIFPTTEAFDAAKKAFVATLPALEERMNWAMDEMEKIVAKKAAAKA